MDGRDELLLVDLLLVAGTVRSSYGNIFEHASVSRRARLLNNDEGNIGFECDRRVNE